MIETFVMQFAGTLFGATLGGFAAWVAIKIDVAIARQIAEGAAKSSADAHVRLYDHIDRHHVKG